MKCNANCQPRISLHKWESEGKDFFKQNYACVYSCAGASNPICTLTMLQKFTKGHCCSNSHESTFYIAVSNVQLRPETSSIHIFPIGLLELSVQNT